MLRIRVLWFGRPARSPFEPLVADFRKRVSRRWPADDVPLRPYPRSDAVDRHKALNHEAATVLDRLPESWVMVALDEHGTAMCSQSFATLLEDHEQSGVHGVVFVIGSDLGLDPVICARAANVVSLSSMTLPHLVARLVLWEQLFRATDILGPGHYHRT